MELTTTAFLVVDVYGLGFSSNYEGIPHEYPSMSLAASTEKEKMIIVEHILPAIEAARRAGLKVIYLSNSAPRIAINQSQLAKVARRSSNLDWAKWGSEDTIDPREYHYGASTALKYSKIVEPQPDDYFIRKHAYSGFFETRLDGLLRNLGIKTLICVGFALDLCLGTTMIDTMNLNYQIVLLRDCTLALEMPWEVEELLHTKRMILWAEIAIGYTTTSSVFITGGEHVAKEERS